MHHHFSPYAAPDVATSGFSLIIDGGIDASLQSAHLNGDILCLTGKELH